MKSTIVSLAALIVTMSAPAFANDLDYDPFALCSAGSFGSSPLAYVLVSAGVLGLMWRRRR